MITLTLGLVLFLGMHSTRILAEEKRTQFIRQHSENAWKVLYSAVSLVGLLLIIYGYGQTRLQPLVVWSPPAGMAHLTALLTLIAFVLVASAYVPGNRLKQRVGHPMVLGVKVWALAHLLCNGRLGDMLLFGAFLLWAIADFAACRRRDRRSANRAGEHSSGAIPDGHGAARAVGTPGTGVVSGTMGRDAISVVIGLAAWLIFAFWLHRAWIGVSPFG